MAKRTAEQAEETRAALIGAGVQLFGRDGYKKTSLAAISEKAGTTKGALFHHFTGKEELFHAVWAQVQLDMDTNARDVAIAARSQMDPYAAFLAGCRTYLEWVGRSGFQQIVLFDGPSVLGAAGWYEQDNALGHKNVLAGVTFLSKKGLIAEHRVKALALLLQNALNGAGFALSRQAEGMTTDILMESFEVLLRNAR